MNLPTLTADDWDLIAEQLRSYVGSRLDHAMRLAVEHERSLHLDALDSPSTDTERTQYLRGLRAGLARALTIPADLGRLANRRAPHGD